MLNDREILRKPESRHNRRNHRHKSPGSVLVVDVGGSNVKVLVSGRDVPRKVPSGRSLAAAVMVRRVLELAHDWDYDAVSIGYPGAVGADGPAREPKKNLGEGWVGFDFAAASGKPVRVMNDAAMQALGGYQGGRMLFLGLGTSIGSALVSRRVIIPLELGPLPQRHGGTLAEVATAVPGC